MKKKLMYFIAVLCITTGLIIYTDNERTLAGAYDETVRNEYGYTSLNDTEKKVFNLLGDKLEDFIQSELYLTDLDSENAKLKIEFTMDQGESITVKDLNKIVIRFIYSNPKYYWLENGFSYGTSGNNKFLVMFRVHPYYYEYQSRKNTDDAINGLLGEWVEMIKSEAVKKDDFYAALLAHDLIIRNIDYTYDSTGKPESSVWAHSIAGVFTGEGAVCEGYAKAFEYILDLAGIQNIYIVGKGDGDRHAWNAVKYNDGWYLCDVTWDDPNEKTVVGLKDSDYTYFFTPNSVFRKTHSVSSDTSDYLYDMPSFSDNMDESYYGRFKCYSDISAFNEETGAEFANRVLANRYYGNDFIFMAFPKDASNSVINFVVPQLGVEKSNSYSFTVSDYGYILKLKAPTIDNPAQTIGLDKEEASIDISASVTVTAVLPEGCDDRIIWTVSNFDEKETFSPLRFIKLLVKDDKATVEGLKNGKIILTATAYSSAESENPVKASCIITIGTGESGADTVIWQNGTKTYKKVKLETELTAHEWKDGKGKTKKGKLVWYVADSPLVPSFNSSKHSVSFSSPKSKKASVNGKGEVTAKTAGTVYVYVCDTGSMAFEEYLVEILAAPSKLYVTEVPDSTDKDDIVKKYYMDAGTSDYLYITPFVKNGTADKSCTYTVRIVKDEQKKYATVGDVILDDKGNPYFTIDTLDFDQTKNKTVSVKIEVICNESNKKANMTLVIGNTVLGAKLISAGSSETILSKKGDSASFKLEISTLLGKDVSTTDKIKIYVGKTSVRLDSDDKVIADKGARVKVKFDQKTMTLTLTAQADAGSTAVISVAFLNPVNKEVFLTELARVDENGIIKLTEKTL
ncbi:MAG: hypothetical protein IKP88_08585 [Lachnospiraceae bacterium]|nr:hypothetical protein [Lachnospiraceae bacterium]